MIKTPVIAILSSVVALSGIFSQQSFVQRLKAWESRFDSVQITYRTSKDSAVWTLCTIPTQETLSSNNRVVASYEGGVFYRMVPKSTGDLTGMSYGSYASRIVMPMLSDSRSILFVLGALLVGDQKTSDSLLVTARAHCDVRDGSFVEFEWPLGAHEVGTERIEWTRPDDVPARVTLRTRGLALVRDFYPSGARIWPLRIHEQTTFSQGGRKVQRWLKVEEPKPATRGEKSLRPKPGDKVMDENFNITYVEGEPTDLNPTLAAKTIACAFAGRPWPQSPARQLLCGLDCLYYIAKFHNIDISVRRLDSLLPEAKLRGCSFAELRRAASALGIRLRGYRLTVEDLRRNGKMAILSLRNSHFGLIVPRGSNPMALIDPPYSVRILRDEEFQVLWTGDALVDEP